MATQTISCGKLSVMSAIRTTHLAKTSVVRAVPCSRPSQIDAFAPQRSVSMRSRKVSTVTRAAGNGLSIDLRGK